MTGQILASAVSSAGWFFHINNEIQNVIQGYHNTLQILISLEPLFSHSSRFSAILAMDEDTLAQDLQTLEPDGCLIYDEIWTLNDESFKGCAYPVPFNDLAMATGGTKLMRNMVGLGVIAGMIGLDEDNVVKAINNRFSKKSDDVIEKNILAMRAGYEQAKKIATDQRDFKIVPQTHTEPLLITSGNMLAAMAAIKAGCRFFSAYPMTPSTSILHFLAKHAAEYKMSVHHVEDELSAVNMAIGAGFAGARSMVATSGGGYALMTEAISLAGMLEVPVVIIEVQRPGPSTGLPTRTGQGDLRQVLHAGQGDFPHIVLSPGTHEEVFGLVFEAFNMAEKYQCPVTVLMEKYLAESFVNLPRPDTRGLSVDRGLLATNDNLDIGEVYQRYKISADGISPRSIPGMVGGSHTASSYEHGEDGYFTEDPAYVSKMNEKRMCKMETLSKTLPAIALEGVPDAEVTLVCWGSTLGPARQATVLLKNDGVTANILHIKYLRPLQPMVHELLSKSKRPILIEGNISAQLGGLIREQTGYEIVDKILDYSGRPFAPERIAERIKRILTAI